MDFFALFTGEKKKFFKKNNSKLMYKSNSIVCLPRYQYIVPNSCGPCDTMHVSITSLPNFTQMSVGPMTTAFASAKYGTSVNKISNKDDYDHLLYKMYEFDYISINCSLKKKYACDT